jgi:hypothetical protein
VVVERAEEVARLREHAKTLLRLLLRRDVLERADREADRAVGVCDRRRAHDRPEARAGLADAVADDLLRGDAGEREPPGQALELEGSAVLVEHLEARDHVGDRRREELGRTVEADEPRCRVVRVDDAAVPSLDADPVGDLAEDRLELGARLQELGLAAAALGRGGDVAPDRLREPELALGEVPRLVAVEHELADEPRPVQERDERERADAFAEHVLAKRAERRVLGDVADRERARIGARRRSTASGRRRRRGTRREPSPGAEAHHALVVEEEQRRARRGRLRDQLLERDVEDLVDALQAIDGRRDARQALELSQASAELIRTRVDDLGHLSPVFRSPDGA